LQDQTRNPKTCCAIFFHKMFVFHHIQGFVYEQDEENCFLYEYNCLSTETERMFEIETYH